VAAPAQVVESVPEEAADAVLHNPDMGWVLYENYPLDQSPGSATLRALPAETFPEADAVALMFSWQDVERREGEYDFRKADFAYEYWRERGKSIQLRLSTETLVWWSSHTPPAGKGIPDYVLAEIPPERKQTRTSDGHAQTYVDGRDPFYLERLTKFLTATAAHFSGARAVSLVDLRGFGKWGEWHSGYAYASPAERRAALALVIDAWSAAFPNNWLSLSYSYDPDGPPEYFAGPTDRYEERWTDRYAGFLSYSAFDHALTKRNVTFRRDGAGGAVHANERRLCEEAFHTLTKGPMMCEFLGGDAAAKQGRDDWVAWMVKDALSLHPNYVNLLGWQGEDALAFTRERPDLIAEGLRTMGYRLVPLKVKHPATLRAGQACEIEFEWVNRGVGRAMRDFMLKLSLCDRTGAALASCDVGAVESSRWVKGQTYRVRKEARFDGVTAGDYELCITLHDPQFDRLIALPLKRAGGESAYRLARIRIE
jgi:hypothetical protein